MKTSTMLRIYRVTCVVLVVLLALMPLIYGRHIIFATSATTVLTLVLILIAFQVQRLRMLTRTIAKLDELLRLLESTRNHLSFTESQQLHRELSETRGGAAPGPVASPSRQAALACRLV